MTYTELAEQLMQNMQHTQRQRPQRDMADAMRGGTFILHYLSDRDEPVLPSEISREMDISTARIAAALGNLESKGLILREMDKTDRRRILVTLTDAGRVAHEQQRQKMLAFTAGMLERLGPEDAVHFVRIMGKIASFPHLEPDL